MYRNITVSTALLIAALAPFPSEAANRRQSYDELAGASDKVVLGTVGVKSSHWGPILASTPMSWSTRTSP